MTNDDPIAAAGDILVANGTSLPASMALERQPGPSGWFSVAKHPDGQELGKQLSSAGWTFFYLAGSVTATSIGFNKRTMVNTAVKRLIACAKLQKCNCLQIDEVSARSFLGIRYVSVSAHSRHIQKEMFFSNAV